MPLLLSSGMADALCVCQVRQRLLLLLLLLHDVLYNRAFPLPRMPLLSGLLGGRQPPLLSPEMGCTLRNVQCRVTDVTPLAAACRCRRLIKTQHQPQLLQLLCAPAGLMLMQLQLLRLVTACLLTCLVSTLLSVCLPFSPLRCAQACCRRDTHAASSTPKAPPHRFTTPQPPPNSRFPCCCFYTPHSATQHHIMPRDQTQQHSRTHIFESLLGAPPVTLATRRACSSCFSSFSCWQVSKTAAHNKGSSSRALRGCRSVATGRGVRLFPVLVCQLHSNTLCTQHHPQTHLIKQVLLGLLPELMCLHCGSKKQAAAATAGNSTTPKKDTGVSL